MTVTNFAPGQFKSKLAARVARLGLTIIMSSVTVLTLAGCQTVKLSPTTSQPSGGGNAAAAIPVAGNWQVSYSVGGETQSAHMNISQSGNSFQGVGVDDSTQGNFVIDAGVINGKSITFHKRYHVEENPNLPPIIYIGSFEMAKTAEYSGPYMSGTYKVNKNGQLVEGQWDAQIDGGGAATATPTTQQPEAPQAGSNRRPHLSGKWDAGYEFEFKTVHASMYLEQDGTKITGHGMDKANKEAFNVKGTYTYPNIKMWVKYLPVKAGPKSKAKPERTLEFRGKADVVNEAEYQGTRLEGKTNGGGIWMAEQVK
ncbi:MAG: hypothetical protein Q8T09_05375 [Candidatus Melainabacteria bacterium]|nr:hypothetical protein [Candidatus Melainabacteria bacterium]